MLSAAKEREIFALVSLRNISDEKKTFSAKPHRVFSVKMGGCIHLYINRFI